MLFNDIALQSAYEHLLEGKKGAILRISYCENFEKREIRENMFSHRLHGYHGFIFNHELHELRSTAVGKVNCSNLSFFYSESIRKYRNMRKLVLTDDNHHDCFAASKG